MCRSYERHIFFNYYSIHSPSSVRGTLRMSNVCLCELRRRAFTIYKQVCIVRAGTNFATPEYLYSQRSAESKARLSKGGGC